MSSRGAVFFDRDGTLIETSVKEGLPFAKNNPKGIVFLPGAIDLCRELSSHGIQLFLITNQPDVARGKVSINQVNEVNSIVKERCLLTDVETCIHDDKDECTCRKPLPGMIFSLASRHGTDLTQSFVVGDRWRDVETGQNAGCKTIFINYGYQEKTADSPTMEVQTIEEAGLQLKRYFGLC